MQYYYDPQQLQPAFPQLTAPVYAGPSYVAPPPHTHPGWQGEWEEDKEDSSGPEVSPTTIPPPRTVEPNALASLPKKVKHRRRTTPEQLRVLEHWFNINPKPDNSMREWLAMELGMTKRNIQVWFQNRRAKVKNLALKEAAQVRTPPKSAPAELDLQQQQVRPPIPHHHTHPQSYLSPPATATGRRVSLADGEAQKIQMIYGQYPSPLRSPTAPKTIRKTSMPYPSPIPENVPSPISPVGRSASALHLTAINNSRRASVPTAQTITSGPFTPPRFGDKPYQDLTTTYVTPPTSTYNTNFYPNAPLPSPGFSFGSQVPESVEPGPWTWAPRGRIGSVASMNTFTTEGTESSWDDWQNVPEGFDPENRRASAPAELLQQLGVLGLNPNIHLRMEQAHLAPVIESPNPSLTVNSGTGSSPHFVTPPFQQRRQSTSPQQTSPDKLEMFEPAPVGPGPGFGEYYPPQKEVMTAEQFFVDLGSIDPAVMR